MNEESYITIVERESPQKIEVLFQEEVQLDINVPLFYIKSGEEEIQHYVEKFCKPDVIEFIENKKSDTLEHIDEYTNNMAIKAIEECMVEKKAVIANYAMEAENSAQLSSQRASDALNYAEISAEQATHAQNANKEIADKIDNQGIKNKITNCITEIPQDIKLELNNGTLTLKAGSKVYVPNGKDSSGNNVFDEVVVSADKTFNNTGGSGKYIISYRASVEGIGSAVPNSQSGATTPDATTSYRLFYNTSENKMYFDQGSWFGGYTLPLAIVSASNGSITSINQVFNGFGYIGSTVFALPGVKGLIPNGRNADGTLKNIEWSCSSVVTRTFSSSDNYNGTACGFDGSSFSRLAVGVYLFSETENLNKNGDTIWRATHIDDNFVLTGGIVTSFNPKLPFCSIDYSDSSWVAGQAMPGNKHITLTLGADGASYTAPANGWFYLNKESGAINQRTILLNSNATMQICMTGVANGTLLASYIPVKKGDIVKVYYTATGATHLFRFVYAEGEI